MAGSDPADEKPGTGRTVTDPQPEQRTFLIADIRGYTRYTDEHGDEAAAALAARFAQLVREVVKAGGGTLVELRGDEALTVFVSSRQALRVAVDLQARFAADSLPQGVGIGLDTGEAVPVEGGYRGSALNVAARLCAQAGPGEILATETVTRLAAHIDGIRYGSTRTLRLKGLEQPIRAVRLTQGAGSEAPAVPAGRAPVRRIGTVGRRAAGLVAVALFVASVGAALVAIAPRGNTGATPGVSAGAIAASPSDWPIVEAADIASYKGSLSRTNVMPGPGVEGSPKLRWQFEAHSDIVSPPALADGRLYAGSVDGILHVVDLATGKEAWQFNVGSRIQTTPTVADGVVYVTGNDGVLHAINISTQQQLWKYPGAPSNAVPTVDGQMVYLGLGSGRFIALSTAGDERWHLDNLPGDAARLAIANDTAYATSDQTNVIYAVDLKNQVIRWQFATQAAHVITPAVADKTLYAVAVDVAGGNSALWAIDAGSGKELWHFATPGRAPLSTLAVGDSDVYTTSEEADGNTLWAIDRSTGKERWHRQIKEGPLSHPAIVGDHLYVASSAGFLHDIDATTSNDVWRFEIGGPVTASPIVSGGLAVVGSAAGGSTSGGLWAVESEAGPAPSTAAVPVKWLADLKAGDGKPALYLNVALDAKGNVYGADRFNDRVVIWDAAGKPTLWGKHGSRPGEFDFREVTLGDQSQSVAIAADGRIAVGDGGNHRVQIFDGKRKFLRIVGHEGTGPGEFVNPCCVAFDPQGRLYAADPGRDDIQVFDKAGKLVRTIGSSGSGHGQFLRLGVPYIDPATGNSWVPDFGNRRIQVVAPDGAFVAIYGDGSNGGPQLAETNGVVLDSAGRMFIVDGDNFLWVLDPEGKQIAKLGPEVQGHGFIWPPYLALSADGKVYLPDTTIGSDRIVVLQLLPPLWPPP